jgi:hypothetical protein
VQDFRQIGTEMTAKMAALREFRLTIWGDLA